MKQVLLLLAMLSACIGAAKAQNLTTDIPTTATSIRGRVLTEDKQPVEFANVTLLSPDSTFVQGTCSGSDGSFEIVPPAGGRYLLQVSSIGYKTVCRPCHTGEAGMVCILKADAVMLAETVVTAARPVFKLKSGKLETGIQQTLLASLNNAHEVLKHIPGLRSTDEGYTVFGKGTPVIYIDNRLVQDPSELERLAASDIDKVELITNPGAEYDATVKAVVRVRTLQGKEDGAGGSLRAGVTQRRRTGHSEQISLNYRKKGLSLQGMVYANGQNRKHTQEVRYLIPSGVQWDVNNRVHLRRKGLLAGGSASISYDFGAEHSIGASYEFHRTPNFHSGNQSEYTVRADDVPTDRTVHAAQSLQQDSKHQVNAYYQGRVKQLKISLTADWVRGKSYNHQEAREASRTEGDRDISSFNHAANRLYAAKLVLTHPLWKGELKGGADYSFIRRTDRFLNLQNILPGTDSRIDESKSAAFAEYSLGLGKANLLAGLRFEHAVSDYWEQGEYIPGQSRTYNDWCPHLSVDFPLGKTQTNLSYTVKSNRPAFFQLRSTLSYNNRFVYEGGNPLLTPETNHDVQLTTLYRWMQFGINYQYRRNAIAFMTKEYEGNPDAVVFTTGNFKRMQYLTASAHLSPTLGLWKPELGVYFVQPFFKVVNQDGTRSMNRSSVYLSLQNSFRLPHKWILSLDANYQSEGNFGAMLQGSYWGVDMGIRKAFLHKRLTVSLQANDLWNSRYGSFMLFGPRMTYTKKTSPDSRSFSLNISYRFRAAGKVYKGGHAVEEDLRRL